MVSNLFAISSLEIDEEIVDIVGDYSIKDDIMYCKKVFSRKGLFNLTIYVFWFLLIIKSSTIIAKSIMYYDSRLYYSEFTSGIVNILNNWYLNTETNNLPITTLINSSNHFESLIQSLYEKNKNMEKDLFYNLILSRHTPSTIIDVEWKNPFQKNITSECRLFMKKNNTSMKGYIKNWDDLNIITSCILQNNIENLKYVKIIFSHQFKHNIIDNVTKKIYLCSHYTINYMITLKVNTWGIGSSIGSSTDFIYLYIDNENNTNLTVRKQKFIFFTKNDAYLYFDEETHENAKSLDEALTGILVVDLIFSFVISMILCILLKKLYTICKKVGDPSMKHFKDCILYLLFWPFIFIIGDIVSISSYLYRKYLYYPDHKHNVTSGILDGLSFIFIWISTAFIFSSVDVFNKLVVVIFRVFPTLGKYFLSYSVIFVGFAIVGYAFVGLVVDEFNGFESTSQILFALINGDNAFATLSLIKHHSSLLMTFSRVFICIFTVFSAFIALPVFIATITNFFIVKDDSENGDISKIHSTNPINSLLLQIKEYYRHFN